ncbi:MAG: hypothetical protein L6R00_06330 [Phycisphaerae bacterium]|nr:hypothetical protein [Phycisphaerae bacterium]
MADPLNQLDLVVIAAVRDFPAVQRIAPEHLIQTWEQEADLRGTLEQVQAARLRIDPAPSSIALAESSGELSFSRRYLIWFGSGSIARSEHNRLVTAVTAALARLLMGRGPDGEPLAIDTSPLRIENVTVGDTDPDVEPLAQAFGDDDRRGEPFEFTDAIELTVLAMADRDAFIAAALAE